jgi:hypothetical protein
MMGDGTLWLVGYTKANYGVRIANTAEQISAFIMAHPYEDAMITDIFDLPEIEVKGGFIQYCRDQKFLGTQLIPTLAPMQMGDVEPPEFVPLEEEED